MRRYQAKLPRRHSAKWYLLAGLVLISTSSGWQYSFAASVNLEAVSIVANFSARQAVEPDSRLELRTSRALAPGEGSLAVFIGITDVTALCTRNEIGITYTPGLARLPSGESSVIVYLVTSTNEWTEIARLPLLVEDAKATTTANQNGNAAGSLVEPGSAAPSGREAGNAFQLIPSVSVNIKSESVALFFPESTKPDRINATDIAIQASVQGNYKRGSFSTQNQFDLAGSSVQNEALRFGQLGANAMQVDLSSYLMQYKFGKSTLKLGHVSFGTNRHLVNSFSSRGISLSVPINKRFDVSAAAMNGTSIVGFNNFLGLTQSKHQVLSAGGGLEFFPKRPGGLRMEVTMLNGSLLPLSNFNQGSVTDTERSRGVGIRIVGSDKAQRLRFDGGVTRSRFTNPTDPLLNQGFNVIPVKPVSRNAHYLDVSYEVFRSVKVSEKRPLDLSAAFRHEKVDPLYRSVAAFASADRLNNQWGVNGSIGDITFAFNHTRSNDNLADIRSVLKTLTRREAANIALSTSSLFGDRTQASGLLPRLSYNYDRLHQFATFVPVNGDFVSLTQIPNQVGTNHSFGAEWQLSSALRMGYRFNYSFQDNQQTGRERSDFLTEVNSITFGWNAFRALDLNFDVSAERSSVFDQNTLNKTLRFGPALNWRMTNTMVWALNASTTGAGDRANTNHRRDVDLDVQYSWRFLTNEKTRLKKVQGQFFIRYANRYGRASDRLFGINSFTKLQTFNAGLNFIFF